MVDFGEAQVFKGEMAETGYSFVGRELFGPNLGEKFVQGIRIHGHGHCIEVRGRRWEAKAEGRRQIEEVKAGWQILNRPFDVPGLRLRPLLLQSDF